MEFRPPLSGHKILVVEDDMMFRKVISSILEDEGAELFIAEDGRAALKILEEQKGAFKLMISDVRMPEMDGIELLKHVRTGYPDIKVLFLTGFSESLDTREAHRLGAQGLLSKPFKLNSLKEIVLELLDIE